jgi:hypothetical protein
MASRRTYECFQCRDKGFPNVQVFLDGKDDQGKTKYLESDGQTRHIHQGSSAPTQLQQQAATTVVTATTKEDRMMNILNGLTIKVDRLLAILEQKEKNKE